MKLRIHRRKCLAEDGQWFEFVFGEVNMIGNAIELSYIFK